MAHFAELNKKNKVIKVLVFDDSFTDKNCTELLGGVWVKTSYNSNIKKNFAGVGYSYDSERDAFISAKPKNSTGFDEETCKWIVPITELPK
jgi:hypothetical protein